MVPDIATAANASLERVTGLESTTDRSASIVAPLLAGLLISAIGSAQALLLDAVSFAVCAVLIAVWAPRPQARDEEIEEGGYLRQLHSIWRFLSRDRLLLPVALMITVTNLLDMAFSAVLLPVWIRDNGYGPAEIGLIFGAFGVTATIGALLAAAIGDRLPRRATYLIAFVICGAPRFVVLALGAPIWVVVAVSAVGGLGAGFINPILSSVFIERVPRPMLGRVGSLFESMAWAGIPLGGVLAGAAIAGIGLVPALAVAGGAYFLATTLPALRGRASDWGGRGHRVTPGVSANVAAGPPPRPEAPAG